MLHKISIALLLAGLLAGCSSAYYNTLEQFGIHKREILVDRVAEARESQVEAKEQFENALERFRSVVEYDGGELESRYKDLNRELERSEAKAEEVGSRIDAIEDVASALFREWEDELDQYSSAKLRSQSEQQLRETQRRYDGMVAVMRRAEARIQPVLNPFRDQVLWLKHNLNAQAIASLQGEVAVIESDVASLIADLERAIAAADEFMQNTG
ncbi:MAG: DUF2959 domain-containing protein [Gammaproteobacteria bacterium]|nr:DUF2959 domain-containing protein [Gammaproteobacteria bacterium]NNF61529.1 DUF2959 domain-containing protein [Gammaproteobacteria bacterium]NNM19919.1 DUF2959 domain-containing protein [Gammaproteobacteria bacterium]